MPSIEKSEILLLYMARDLARCCGVHLYPAAWRLESLLPKSLVICNGKNAVSLNSLQLKGCSEESFADL